MGAATADGYRGVWYYNQPSDDEYRYKYSGGLGTYCAKHIPLAYYSAEADTTFFCYGGRAEEENRLLHMVSCYDHATGLVPRPTILLDKQTDDAHDNPTIMLDGHGFVWIFSSAHGTERPSYIHRSREPYSVSDFERITETNFSYPQAWYVPGCGFLFLHTRYVDGRRLLHWMTSPDGRTWSEPRPLACIEEGHYQVSWRWRGKVGTAFNYHPDGLGANYRANLYYLETEDFGKTWRTIGGERVTTPLTSADNSALVYDSRREGRLVYLKDINFDSDGNPIILAVMSTGYEAGPEHCPRVWTTAHWDGSQWRMAGSIHSDSNYDTGCLHMEGDDRWLIIGPTEAGPQPYNPGGEMALWLSEDRGETWRKERGITSNSPFNHTYARRPVNAHPDFYAFWADGHGREPSDSRLYFCDRTGKNVRRLPVRLGGENAAPVPLC